MEQESKPTIIKNMNLFSQGYYFELFMVGGVSCWSRLEPFFFPGEGKHKKGHIVECLRTMNGVREMMVKGCGNLL